MVKTEAGIVVYEPDRDGDSNNVKRRKALLLKALDETVGNVTAACKLAGIGRNAFYDYYKADPDFRHAVDSFEEVKLDFAEMHLFKQIKGDIPSSTQFFLKYKGRKRGYEDRSTMQHEGSINLTFQEQFKGV